MSLFTFDEVRSAYTQWRTVDRDILAKSASRVLREERENFQERPYDVFLSHSHVDSKDVLGLCRLLRKQYGLDVYVDVDDEELDGDDVTRVTARVLRKRMKACRSLFYAASVNAVSSKWMPWELGYFDGLKSAVAVLPISDDSEESYKGQEYLALYPYIDQAVNVKTGKSCLWVNGLATKEGYTTYKHWLERIESSRDKHLLDDLFR